MPTQHTWITANSATNGSLNTVGNFHTFVGPDQLHNASFRSFPPSGVFRRFDTAKQEQHMREDPNRTPNQERHRRRKEQAAAAASTACHYGDTEDKTLK
ncbi:hypothetical protein V6N13_088082 [Hibiscus sabdariffa]